MNPERQNLKNCPGFSASVPVIGSLLLFAGFGWSGVAVADPALLPLVSVSTDPNGGQTYTLSLQILLAMTALTLLPALLMLTTSFTRFVIVLALLRQAMGTAQTPSNQVLIGISLFLTLFVMGPVIDRIYADSVAPYMAEEIDAGEAFNRGQQPLRSFMLSHTRESDLSLFAELGRQQITDNVIPLTVLVPAFVTSELKTAFQIGFVLFIPFLIIDLVVASVLMSMGMMMLSPVIISFPFKLMLFVLADGWVLVMGMLVNSFAV